MSDNFPTVQPPEPTTDITDGDLELVYDYIEAGLPNIATVDEAKLTRILDMYLSGKTYRQISQIMQVKKPVILYLSHKFNWFMTRKEYLEDLESGVKSRLMEAKVINQDFLLQLLHFWQKRVGDKMSKYFLTGDEQFAKEVDLKDIDKYLKTLDTLFRINGESGGAAKPSPVGLNLGDGVTIERNDDGTVDITPKQKAIGEALKQFADMRRVQESKK